MKSKHGIDLDRAAKTMGADLIGRVRVRHGGFGSSDMAAEVQAGQREAEIIATTPVTPFLGHEWHAVGNIGACRHCFRSTSFLDRAKKDECPARLRARLNEVEGGTEIYGAATWFAAEAKKCAATESNDRTDDADKRTMFDVDGHLHEQKICPHDGFGCGREECRGGRCHVRDDATETKK